MFVEPAKSSSNGFSSVPSLKEDESPPLVRRKAGPDDQRRLRHTTTLYKLGAMLLPSPLRNRLCSFCPSGHSTTYDVMDPLLGHLNRRSEEHRMHTPAQALSDRYLAFIEDRYSPYDQSLQNALSCFPSPDSASLFHSHSKRSYFRARNLERHRLGVGTAQRKNGRLR